MVLMGYMDDVPLEGPKAKMVKKWSKWPKANRGFGFLTNRGGGLRPPPKKGRGGLRPPRPFLVLYLSKTQAKLVFLWSQILRGPFFDHFLGTF